MFYHRVLLVFDWSVSLYFVTIYLNTLSASILMYVSNSKRHSPANKISKDKEKIKFSSILFLSHTVTLDSIN